MATHGPTLRSLAARAGVSAMTVSLALRNSQEVSAATRRRIQRLAAAHGYRPDPTIARLMHHLRTRRPARQGANIVGLVETWSLQNRGPADYVARLRSGLESRARELGYAFSLLDLALLESDGQLQRVLVNRGVEGIVVLPLRQNTDLSRRIDWTQFCAVSATASLVAPRLHCVTPNHYDNTILACQSLQAAGFKRIGLAITRDWNQRVKYRWSGGAAWQNEFGGTEPVPPLITEQPGPELDPAAFATWLQRARPDVVLTDVQVRPAVAAILGSLPAPTRPPIVSLNWTEQASDAGVDQRPEHIGVAAIEVLTGLLMRGERGVPGMPHTTMIDGRWLEGRIGAKRKSRATRKNVRTLPAPAN